MSIRRNAALNYHQTMELMSNISGFTNKITDQMKNIIENIPPQTNLANVTQNLLPYRYTKHLQDWLDANGNMVITSMVIRRAPITSATNDISQYVSFGAWEKAKQLAGYDSMFHLVLVMNDSFIIQKLSVVDIRPLNEREKAEYMPVPTPYISINNFLNRGRHYMGDKAFFTYNPFENNCQNFVLNLLKGNNLATPKIEGFVIQPLQELIRHLPSWYPTVAHLATNLANLSGSGRKRQSRYLSENQKDNDIVNAVASTYRNGHIGKMTQKQFTDGIKTIPKKYRSLYQKIIQLNPQNKHLKNVRH